MPAENAGRKCL
jgi:hypothetical protein